MAETIHTKTESERIMADALMRIIEACRDPHSKGARVARRTAKAALAALGNAVQGGLAEAVADDCGRAYAIGATLGSLARAQFHAAKAGMDAHFISELHHLAQTVVANAEAEFKEVC